jgi:hypothetical protein
MIKNIAIALLLVFIVLQFIQPDKNNSNIKTNSIETVYSVPDQVKEILKTSCNDCHSNNTVYPWYSNIQPVAWFLNKHVVDGKRHLNFDEFATYRLAKQFHKLEEIDEEVATDEMPLSSYTFMHSNSQLTKHQKDVLINWSKSLRDSMSEVYPKDSLVLKRKK